MLLPYVVIKQHYEDNYIANLFCHILHNLLQLIYSFKLLLFYHLLYNINNYLQILFNLIMVMLLFMDLNYHFIKYIQALQYLVHRNLHIVHQIHFYIHIYHQFNMVSIICIFLITFKSNHELLIILMVQDNMFKIKNLLLHQTTYVSFLMLMANFKLISIIFIFIIIKYFKKQLVINLFVYYSVEFLIHYKKSVAKYSMNVIIIYLLLNKVKIFFNFFCFSLL